MAYNYFHKRDPEAEPSLQERRQVLEIMATPAGCVSLKYEACRTEASGVTKRLGIDWQRGGTATPWLGQLQRVTMGGQKVRLKSIR